MPTKTKPAPTDGAAVFDLDARRAARLERTGPKQVRHGGRVWDFKPELPMQSAAAFESKDLEQVFEAVLIDPSQAADFVAAGDLSADDFRELLAAVYGLAMGESSPSTGS